MNYKKTIDGIRKQQAALRFNIEQISYDISTLPKDLGQLFEEHHSCVRKIRELDVLIEATQPWWRKFIGVRY